MPKKLYKNLSITPGVYLMKNRAGEILYVGKAANLRRRVSSYFLRPQDGRMSRLIFEIQKIDYQKTDTAIEALILEAELIKKYQPRFNVREKDDTSFLYVEITKDKFPRVVLIRGKEATAKAAGKLYGPFTSAKSIRSALAIIRRIFPWSLHKTEAKFSRPCFDYELGLCPGVCMNLISCADYLKNIKNIRLFFDGKKQRIIKNLAWAMKKASHDLRYEEAVKIRKQIFNLKHIEDVALITEDDKSQQGKIGFRIEGYDISNISGTSAVGSMVVFIDGKPDKNEYRKFKIKTITGSNDVGMLKEVLSRRFRNNWPLPNFILIDGGVPQVNAARAVLHETGLKIPTAGIAKGAERKRNDFIGTIPPSVNRLTLIKVRDEAHRFAISYHKQVRKRQFFR
ncbi:MAG: GIY-YIG nuclease family protein [bacterium]|nr:GIY-YIG nuclease family protein [bacterium]